MLRTLDVGRKLHKGVSCDRRDLDLLLFNVSGPGAACTSGGGILPLLYPASLATLYFCMGLALSFSKYGDIYHLVEFFCFAMC